MKNNKERTFLRLCWICFLLVFKFFLKVLANILETSSKREEYEPTFDELMRGQRLAGSDKYFIPNEKPHKK